MLADGSVTMVWSRRNICGVLMNLLHTLLCSSPRAFAHAILSLWGPLPSQPVQGPALSSSSRKSSWSCKWSDLPSPEPVGLCPSPRLVLAICGQVWLSWLDSELSLLIFLSTLQPVRGLAAGGAHATWMIKGPGTVF